MASAASSAAASVSLSNVSDKGTPETLLLLPALLPVVEGRIADRLSVAIGVVFVSVIADDPDIIPIPASVFSGGGRLVVLVVAVVTTAVT